MSVATRCHGCVLGKHEEHDRDFGIRPGLIGGEWCDCAGQCDQEFAANGAKILAAVVTSEPTP